MNKRELTNIVDEYAKWDKLIEEGKKETNKLKSTIQKAAIEALDNAKVKQVKYWGSETNCATATTSETVKLISYEYLKQIIPEQILRDFVKPELEYKLAEVFKRMIAPICLGNYVEQTVADIIEQMPLSEDQRKLALKKLKGTWEKDKSFLESLGLDEEAAEYWTYFIAEAAAWERVTHLLKVAGYIEGTEEFAKALEDLKKAVIVEEGIKIGIDYETDERES